MFKITVRIYIVLYRDGVLGDFMLFYYLCLLLCFVINYSINFYFKKNHPNYKSSLEVKGRGKYDQRQHLESTVSPGIKLCSCQPPLLSGLVPLMAFQKDLYSSFPKKGSMAFAISMTS